MHETKVVQFARPPTQDDLDALRAAGAVVEHVSAVTHQVIIRLPHAAEGEIRAAADAIRALDQVASLEDDFGVSVSLIDVAPLVAVAELWDRQPLPTGVGATVLVEDARSNGTGIVIGVLDTGLDLNYPDFSGRIRGTLDLTGNVAGVQDGHGHGTHVAGIIGQNGLADRRYVGMAPGCAFRIYKVLADNGSGQATWIARALELALADGCHVVNLSLGGPGSGPGPDFLERMVNAVVARGLIVCVASGNDGPATPYRQSPGRAARAITVGATTKRDAVASFTSRGITDDGRGKPNVYAPGQGIGAARSSTGRMGTAINPVITTASGTSMATPVIAGLVACLLSADPALRGAAAIVKALCQTRGKDLGLEGPRVDAPALANRPYPDAAAGEDRRPGNPRPPGESPCEELLMLLEEFTPEERRQLARRAAPAVRRLARAVLDA